MKTLRFGSADGRIDGGLNVCDPPSLLDPSQAAELTNMWFHNGTLCKRPGQTVLTPIGNGQEVDTMWNDDHGRILLQSGSKLYTYTIASGTAAPFYDLEIPAGQAKAPRGSFIPYNDGYVYFINGVEYIRWDGTAVTDVPTRAPEYRVYNTNDPTTATRITCRSANLLTDYVTIRYDLTSGSVAKLTLPNHCQANLSPVSVTYNDTPITTYTINNLTVSLGTTISANNTVFRVKTKLAAAYIPDKHNITACTKAVDYGADSRIFLCGNGTNYLFVSAAFDPTYFPADGMQAFGPGEPLTGFGKLYDTLILFRARGLASVEFTGSGADIAYQLRTLNPVIGCDMPDSVRTVGNRLVWANTYAGVHMLVSTAREYERNVHNISRNINPLLLAEADSDLIAASSVDFDGCYYLCTSSRVYVWDYKTRPYKGAGDFDDGARNLAWYRFTGIAAAHWFIDNGTLCFFVRGSDGVRKLAARPDDNGTAFTAVYRTGSMDCGEPGRFKNLDMLNVTLRCDTASACVLTVRCDEPGQVWSCPESISAAASETSLTKTVRRALHRRSVRAFSVELTCTSTAAGLNLSDLAVDYRLGAKLR
ncbi:MAG: hypothetical protein ACOXZM_07985 [Eubacteriales bacterium]